MKSKSIIIAMLSVILAGEAIAEVKNYEPVSPSSLPSDSSGYSGTTATTGIVFGVLAGYSNYSGGDTFTNAVTASSRSSGMFNFGGMLGYDLALAKMFSLGLEIDINYTPDIIKTSGGTEVTMDALNVPLMLTGKFVLPIGLNIFIKGGVNYQHNSCSGSFSSSSGINCSNSNKLSGVLAGGIGWQLSNFNFFGQYMYIFGDSLTATGTSGSAIEQSILVGGVSYTLPL
jgi:hypothetical protein